MAIIKDESLSTDGETVFRIDNGDLQALKNIQEAWHLKDLESALIFAVGILRIAKDTPSKKVLVEKEGYTEPIPLNPGTQLVAQEETDKKDGEQHPKQGS